MGNANRIAMSVMLLGLAGGLGACALPGKLALGSAPSAAKDPNTGLATRALSALAANEVGEAIRLAEQAVAWKPEQASFRQLLASAYLAGGRYASAETAYRDALSLDPANAEVALKLALVAIARGRSDVGLETLSQYRSMLDSADVGLAFALAGQPHEAVLMLDAAARQRGADARVRQNLALAYVLDNQWDKARVVAMQDLPIDLVDQRMREWAEIAKPGRPGEKMAQFMGIRPVQDAGMPAQLALTQPMKDEGVAFASVAAPAAPEPIVAAAPEPIVAAAPAPEPTYADPAPEPVAPVTLAKADAGDSLAPARALAAPLSAPRPALTPAAARVAPAAKPVALKARAKASGSKASDLFRTAALPAGGLGAVVQLGSFSGRGQVDVAWDRQVAKHGALKGRTPVTARFAKDGRTFYRLGVAVGSRGEGTALCGKLRAGGGNCFVRSASGDAPVVLASNR